MFGRKKRSSHRSSTDSGAAAPAAEGTIGRYTLESTLGQGGMGAVYLANDPVIGRKVAIKVISARPETEEEARQYRERFLREAQAAGALVHPNIVAVHDIGQDPASGRPYIVMEHVAGQDLKKVIRSRAPLAPLEATRIALQIASALDYAHSRGIVHRDIKPANVLISDGGQVKITDFGVARLPGSDLTQTDQMVGSPGFMSPEQLQGGAVDGRADLFALGVILYQLLTGRSPFEGESVSEVLYRITTQPAEPPSVAHADVSPDFDPILEKALAKDPAGRYQTGMEMIEALRGVSARCDAAGASAAGSRAATPLPRAATPVPGDATPRPRGRAISAWWTLRSQWRLGFLVAALLVTFVGVNWAIHALMGGPLGRLAESAGEGSATAPAGPVSAPGLAVLGGLPAPAGPGAASLKDAIPLSRTGAGRFPGGTLASGISAATRPIVPACAMTYGGPSEIARVVMATRRARLQPASAIDRPAGKLQLEFSHRLQEGRLVVLVDGRTVLSRPFDVTKGKSGGHLSHVLSVPVGRHGVEVRVLSGKGTLEARSKIAGTVPRTGTSILKAQEKTGSRKPLRLEWD